MSKPHRSIAFDDPLSPPSPPARRSNTVVRYPLEMQSSAPAAHPYPNFRPGRAFCGARTKGAGIMTGSEETITMYQCIMHWPPGFVRCLKDRSRARCWAHQTSCDVGLGSGLALGALFTSAENPPKKTSLARQCRVTIPEHLEVLTGVQGNTIPRCVRCLEVWQAQLLVCRGAPQKHAVQSDSHVDS